MEVYRAGKTESRGLPTSEHTPCIGDTYRAREAVAAVSRRRCPRGPIAPERSKQESESWWRLPRSHHPDAGSQGTHLHGMLG